MPTPNSSPTDPTLPVSVPRMREAVRLAFTLYDQTLVVHAALEGLNARAELADQDPAARDAINWTAETTRALTGACAQLEADLLKLHDVLPFTRDLDAADPKGATPCA